MHFKDDPISDVHAKNYIIILCLKHFPGRTKFGPVFWSRPFPRGPVEYNYPFLTQPAGFKELFPVTKIFFLLFYSILYHYQLADLPILQHCLQG